MKHLLVGSAFAVVCIWLGAGDRLPLVKTLSQRRHAAVDLATTAKFRDGEGSMGLLVPDLSADDAQVKRLLSQMTLEEKIGQMTQAEQDQIQDPADIEN